MGLILALFLSFGLTDPTNGFQTNSGQASVDGLPVAPLFASDEVLELSLVTDIRSLTRDRDEDREYHPATLIVAGEQGDSVSVPLRVRTRGNFRRQANICTFPPIRMNFYRDSVTGSVFDGQNRLKLVVHCRNSDQYEQYILQEYLVYRLFNLFSEMSFRVRLARVTYVDTEDRIDTVTRYAFIIEDAGAMAERNGWEELEIPLVPPDVVPQDHMAMVEVFQYMIGNTDFSGFLKSETEDECCHNTIPIGSLNGPVFPIPYDFDVTGIVNTRYASPPPNLPIRSVRERLFRGLCRDPVFLEDALQLFIDKRNAIYDLYHNMDLLDNRVRDRTIAYLDDFFETITDERRVQRELVRTCRPL